MVFNIKLCWLLSGAMLLIGLTYFLSRQDSSTHHATSATPKIIGSVEFSGPAVQRFPRKLITTAGKKGATLGDVYSA